MSDSGDNDLASLRLLQATMAPGPSADLMAAVEDMRPVRPRVPLRSLLIVAAAAAVFPVVAMALYPLRRDLGALPKLWVGAVGALWLAGFLIPLAFAILPPAGQVLPNSARAGRSAVLAGITLVLVGLLFTVDAPGVTLLPPATWSAFVHFWWHCVSFSLKVSIPAVVAAAFVLRRLKIAGLARLGAAVGAAAGALSGLALHGLCPIGGAAHVGLAHGGGVVIGGLLGALWLPLLIGLTQPRGRG